MQRIFKHRLCAVLLLLFAATVGSLEAASPSADDPRMTPRVKAVRRAVPSVVNIHSEKTTYGADPLFKSGKGRKVNGMGTGVVIDERGYIVTNHHVVDGVDSLRVTLHDGATYMASVVSTDRKHDLAVIRIKANGPLPVMPLGTSSDLMLGESVIAVGNAFGYEHTVTAGIVSALSRDVEVNEKQAYKNLIQTDASINPGNSGGPLLNLRGEVVGINVAIRAGAQRIGFAIPIDDARRIIARLISVEKLDNNFHGLDVVDRKTPQSKRLVVNATRPDSPGSIAGFRKGDVVVKAGEVKVDDAVDFERALLGKSLGDEIDVTVRRDGEDETLHLKLARRGALTGKLAEVTQSEIVVRANNDASEPQEWKFLGVKLREIAAQSASIAGSRYRGGMRIVDVRPGGPAAANGIRRGDILVGLHLWETTNKENVSYVLDHPNLATFAPLKFYILRNGETLYGHMQLASN